jgi:outer membrane protein
MKHPLIPLLALIACSLAAPTAKAQTAPKIVLFDLTRLFEAYWKTQQEEVKLAEDEAKFEKEVVRMQKEQKTSWQQMETLRKQAGPLNSNAMTGPGIINAGSITFNTKTMTPSDYTNPQAAAEADKKEQEFDTLRMTIPDFLEKYRRQLRQRMETFKKLMFDEISKVAIAIAKAHGGMLLLDKSGPTLVGISSVVYCDPSLDITDEVMAAINKDRPANLPKPTGGWANGLPTIGFPGFTPGTY